VWGYWLLGYLLIAAVVFSVMLIVRLITGQWPS
jgi:hypothetical protein